MNFTDEQRDQAYENSSEMQKSLYEGPKSGLDLSEICKNHGLVAVEARMSFLVAVGDVILGLVPQEKLPELLVERLQVSGSDAMRITADILDFLEPLNSDTKAEQLLKAASTAENTIPINVEPSYVEPDTLAAELAETEAAFKQLQPIRTMAHDMETIKQVEEPVHQATDQETILNGQGNAQKNESAQWGTPEK